MLKKLLLILFLSLFLIPLAFSEESETLYFSHLYHVEDGKAIKYYPIPGGMVMMKENTLYYIYPDHIGSTSVITDSSGNEQSGMDYYPYGLEKESSGEVQTERKYTGQILDDSIAKEILDAWRKRTEAVFDFLLDPLDLS